MARAISLKIDGSYVKATEGQSILEVARASGIHIPTLCYFEGLQPAGACRLCVVEVAGVNRLLPSCTTPVREGMSVVTNSEKIAKYRRMVVEFLLAERNHHCAVCVSNGRCELQALATSLGVTHVPYPYVYPALSVDLSHERFVLDHNRCVLCTRCVRVCAEVEGAHVWDVKSRGIGARIVAELDRPWGEAESCTSCGKCVQVCPTGALAEKGWAVEEMAKSGERVARLAIRKGGTK
ncbi:MAG: bidirectional hydrogenase complex protein HoxU [Planctomycetota bacterium]